MKEFGVPASITLAQGMLESSNGNSTLAVNANNHFGIKCHSDWTGDTYHMDDDAVNECFRKYPSVLDSYRDHSKFLKNRTRYAALFLLEKTDYKGWAQGLKDAGYATNSKYPQLLVSLIERYSLQQYDTVSSLPADTTARKILVSSNHVKYIIAREGDTWQSLAKVLQMHQNRLMKYNDANDSTKIGSREYIYIQPKRRKATVEIYIVENGDTYRSIAQKYAIKLKHLYKKNNSTEDVELKAGSKLYLRKKKK